MTCSVLLVPMQPSPNQCQSEKKSRRMKECGSAPWLSRIGGDAATQLARVKTGNKLQLPRVGKLRAITVVPSQPVVLSFTSGETSSTKALLMASSIPIGRKEVRGRKAHTDMIEEKEPGCLRELCRHATRIKGAMATFKELADCMSAKSATPDEDRLTISLHRLQLFRWWKKQGGEEKSSIEKPRLTPPNIVGSDLIGSKSGRTLRPIPTFL